MSPVRIFVPVTSSGLAALVDSGRLAGPMRAHAVTDALVTAWPEGDDEEWEYAAMSAAADSSRELRGEGDLARRFVVAADVPAAEPVPGEDPTLVDVAADVTWKNVAAAHVDVEDDPDDDAELAWFARQEIRDLLV